MNLGLYVNLGGESDLVVIGPGTPGGPAPTFYETKINVGAPPLTVSGAKKLASSDAFLANDNDDVIIWGLNTTLGTAIDTGAGNDWVYMKDATVGLGGYTADLTIRTGSGADDVTFRGVLVTGNTLIQTYDSLAENDADIVWFDTFWGQGKLTVRLADGDDTMTLDYLWGDDFYFLGEGGTDSLTKSNIFGNVVAQDGWEWINGRLQLGGVKLGGTGTLKLA